MGLTGLWDRFHCTEFHAPSFHALHSGITGQGRPREEGYLIKVMNGITPIDAHSSHYFYAFSRNFGIEDQSATDALVEGLRTVLQEDADALALQEIGLQSRPPGEFDVLIAQDAGVAKARKVMERLLRAEQTGSSVAELEPAST
jgi:vanillate O-demethylase monooxygenase subunit